VIPTRTAFFQWRMPYNPLPIKLEVSFSTQPPLWYPVDEDLAFTHHEVPSRSSLAYVISPRQGLASVAGANVTIQGSGFPYPTTRPLLPGCLFGRTKYMPADVLSSKLVRCQTPLLKEISEELEPPMDVRIDLTFDGGQSVTQYNSVYTYLLDFVIDIMVPTHGMYNSYTEVFIYGDLFERTPRLSCRFGDKVIEATLLSSKRLTCRAPPQATPGEYPFAYSVDGQTFRTTDHVWHAIFTPFLWQLEPKRGFRVGGTVISVFHDGLTYAESLRCSFGYVLMPAQDRPGTDFMTCTAPPCKEAMWPEGIPPPGVEETECYGFVTVQMTLNGIDYFGNLTYEYVRMPKITHVNPFPASGWDNELLVGLFGENYFRPMYCRWLNLNITEAVDISPTSMKCTAPRLPEYLRPANTSADYLLGYVEVSPNKQDWTRNRFEWLWYKEPEVEEIVPNSTFRTYAPEGDFVLYGGHYRLVRQDMISCLWLYDVYLPPEVVEAELLARDVLRCRPRQPAAPRMTSEGMQPIRHPLEVSMTSWVISESKRSVLAEERMFLDDRKDAYGRTKIAVEPKGCWLTGGCPMTLRGVNFWPADQPDAELFVAVGDTLLPLEKGPEPQTATFRLPPLAHMPPVPRNEPIWLTRNLQDRTPITHRMAYFAVPLGQYYRPELHHGEGQMCPPGHYCTGAAANQTLWVVNGESPVPCPPSTWSSDTGGFGCYTCPEGVTCPSPAMTWPQRSELGLINWIKTGYDANMALCPAGVMCVRPPHGKTIVVEQLPYQDRRLQLRDSPELIMAPTVDEEVLTDSAPERRLRIPSIPNGVVMVPCPPGYHCPPGTIAQVKDDGSVPTGAYPDGLDGYETPLPGVKCSLPGIVCSEGATSPIVTDVVPLPGQYVAPNNSMVLICPRGSSCPGGPGPNSASPKLCPPGQYQVTPGAPSCATCTAGTMCPGFGATAPKICPAGRVCALPGRVMPTYLCPAGSYCPPGVITLNTLSGLPNSPIICPPGLYCLQGTSSVYINDTGTGTARNCVEGTFCGANSTDPGGSDNCPPGWYCLRGVETPLPSPPGHYVGKSGAIYPSKCRPGSYAPRWLMTACLACPPGTECPLDGTVVPTFCRAGTYREATPAGVDFSKNVMCIPCPQGTWSQYGSLTLLQQCKSCAERYVCPMEGTTKFATIDQPCGPNPGPDEICYPQMSSGADCPQGYSCPLATTGFTQFDEWCEPGYWCKVRTIPREIRNLLCPPGYYCKRATGESGGSGRKSFECPLNHYCPEGTAAVDGRIDNQLVTILYNVQADVQMVTEMDPDTRSMCRKCPEDTPPGRFNLSLCMPCGKEIFLDEEGYFPNASRRLGSGFKVAVLPYQGEKEAAQDDLPNWITGATFKNQMQEFLDLPDFGTSYSVDEARFLRAQSASHLSEDYVSDDYLSEDSWEESTDERRLQMQDWNKCAPDITHDPPVPWQPGMRCFVAMREWQGNLQCPRGTSSNIKSSDPDDCKQIGTVIAVQNIYKCYPNRPCAHRRRRDMSVAFTVNDCNPTLPLCNITEEIEIYKSDPTFKKSYLYGDPISNSMWNRNVTFLGYDTDLDLELYGDRTLFHQITLEAMDEVVLYFDFSNMNPTTRLYSRMNGDGHVDINIYSNQLPQSKLDIKEGYTLPMFFQRPENARAHHKFEMKMLALKPMEFSVQLDLRHGGHVEFLHTLNESLDIVRQSPSRTEWGTRKFFAAVLSRELLLDGNYELPYNMPPGEADHPGEDSVIIDAVNVSGRFNAPQNVQTDGDQGLLKVQTTGKAYWQAKNVDTWAMPWLPYFSQCELFDSHINLWDLFEMPFGVREGCERYDKEQIRIVPNLGINFDDLTIAFTPTADNCEFVVKCHYEESMIETDNTYIIWREIKRSEMGLFYLTRNPITYEEFSKQDNKFREEVGGDDLIRVKARFKSRTARFPRRIQFFIHYFQKTQEQKVIVKSGMNLEQFDDDTQDTSYYLKIQFRAMRWEELMNNFELPLIVYAILYCVIGGGAVAFTLISWFIVRLGVQRVSTPPFRLWECYDFMLWWPLQGVLIASIPMAALCTVIKLSFQPWADLTQDYACTYDGFSTGQLDIYEQQRCRNGRTGTCFLIGGVLMMWSGSKMLVPQLREEEEQFLLQQPTQMLNKEGIPLPSDQRPNIRQLPIRYKRGHLIFISVLLVLPSMSLWEFTYSDFFGVNALYFIIAFSFAMNFVDQVLGKAMREELLLMPLSGAVNVVLFIGTLGANDFTDFCEGFFIELLIGIVERLALAYIVGKVTGAVNGAIRWVRTRNWFWRCIMGFKGIFGFGPTSLVLNIEEDQIDDSGEKKEGEEEEDDDDEVDGTPIEEAMDEIIGCGTTCMSTIQAPFLIAVIMVFPKETMIPEMYGIKQSDLMKYLLFGLVIAPFQVMMDILMNHAVEIKDGVKIYDYMLYAKMRWRNRLYRWLFDDPQMDKSIAEPLQSVNHLAFSPQFYFIETYYSYGMLMLLIAVTILLRYSMNPFDDPMMFYFIIQQILCNILLNKIVTIMTSRILWKPQDNAVYRAFSRSVEHSLKRKEEMEVQAKFRRWFLLKYTDWIVMNMAEIFTPRAKDSYVSKLSELYQNLLALQPKHTYKAAGPAFPPVLAHEELPAELRAELEESDSSDSEEKGIIVLPAQTNVRARRREALPELPALPPLALPGMSGTSTRIALREAAAALAPLPHPPQPPEPMWHAIARPDDLYMPEHAGFGPFAGLIGRAWYNAARRHVQMKELAEMWRMEQNPLDACDECGRQEDDVLVRIKLEVVLVKEIHYLTDEFEKHYHNPHEELDEDIWKSFLVREDAWKTLCQDCACEQGPTRLSRRASKRQAALAAPKAMPELTDSPGSEPGSSQETPESSSDDAGDKPDPSWQAVEVSNSSREMILYWAGIARRRWRERRQQLIEARRLELEDASDPQLEDSRDALSDVPESEEDY